jgi:hypothetical protein
MRSVALAVLCVAIAGCTARVRVETEPAEVRADPASDRLPFGSTAVALVPPGRIVDSTLEPASEYGYNTQTALQTPWLNTGDLVRVIGDEGPTPHPGRKVKIRVLDGDLKGTEAYVRREFLRPAPR